jgi:hypothetical protein
MIEELTGSVDQLRDEAQADRKAARKAAEPAERERLFGAAIEKFEDAIRRLERGHRGVQREQASRYSTDECVVLERLSQTYGSLGGTWRDFALTKAGPEREEMLVNARARYRRGNEYEEERRKFCGALDTYNLLQVLVVELLGNAALINDHEFETKLRGVQKEVERQVNAGRNDSWALADLALVSFLAGTSADQALEDIERRNVHKSFYEATHTVVTSLLNEGLGNGGDLTHRLQRFQGLLQRKGGLA